MAEKKSRKAPLGVKVISVWFYISGILDLFMTLFLIAIIFNLSGSANLFLGRGLNLFSDKFIIVNAIEALILGAVFFISAWGLWKLRKWARILAVLLGVFGIINAITSIAANIPYLGHVTAWALPSLIVSLLITCYLLLSKKVKEAFK